MLTTAERQTNPPVQNDIWWSPLSLLRWRLLPLLPPFPPSCEAAEDNTGENNEDNEADETRDEVCADTTRIRHLWRALPADCLPVSTCAALVTCWGGGRAPWKEQQPAPSSSMEGPTNWSGAEEAQEPPPAGRTFLAALKASRTITGA